MVFAILRATNLCGSRKKWRSGTGMDGGAGLPFSEPGYCMLYCIKYVVIYAMYCNSLYCVRLCVYY